MARKKKQKNRRLYIALASTAVILLSLSLVLKHFAKASMMLEICQTPECKTEELSINLAINTNKHKIIASDAVIEYDTEKLMFLGLREHPIFHKTLSRVIEPGQLEVASYLLPPNSFRGKTTLATLHFKIIESGETTLKLKYAPRQTNDSNLISPLKDRDILSHTKDLTLTLNKP